MQNLVGGVAIGADGGVRVALGERQAMDTLGVLSVDARVAASASLGDVDLVCRTDGVFAAQDVVRTVAALAVGGDEQSFFVERVTVNRVDVLGKYLGEAMLLGHAVVTVALSAGLRDIERIDGRFGVALGDDGMRVTVATGARMLGLVGVNAANQPGGFIGVAGLAIDGLDLVRMRKALDVGVACVAAEAAVNAGVEDLAIDIDAFAGRILGSFVVMTGEAIGLRFGDT